jgi:hypothetical protein
VDALVFLPQMEGPVFAVVAAGGEGAELEDGFSAVQFSPGDGEVLAVFGHRHAPWMTPVAIGQLRPSAMRDTRAGVHRRLLEKVGNEDV